MKRNKTTKRNAYLVVVFAVLTVFLAGAVGYVNTLPDRSKAVYDVAGMQDQPYVVYNFRNDQYLAVWSDCRQYPNNCTYGGGDKRSIYGQLFDGQGNCLGGNFIIADQPTGKQHPSVAYNSANNEYLVVWQGHKYDFGGDEAVYYKKGYDIWGQRVSSSGDLLGEEFRISRLSEGSPDVDDDDQQWYPRIAYSPEGDSGGRYMVVWHDGRTRQVFSDLYSKSANDGTTFKDIYGQIIKGDGSLLGENFPVTIDGANSTHQYFGNAKRIQQYADIAYDHSRKRFLVVWEDNRLGSGDPHPLTQWYDLLNMDIYGGFFGLDGQPQGDNFLISGGTKSERYPRVAYNLSHNEFMVVWQEDVNDGYINGNNTYIGVSGQRIGFAGDKIGQKIDFNSQAVLHAKYLGEDSPPRQNVIYNPTNGNYLVSWGERSSASGSFQLYNTEVAVPSGIVGAKILLEGSILGYENILNGDANHFRALLQRPDWAGDNQAVLFKLNNGEIDNCPASGGVPTQPPQTTPSPTPPPGGSATWNEISPGFIGQCHGSNRIGTGLASGVNVSWGYDAGVEFFWKTVEPERGRYVWDTIDEYLAGIPNGQKIWLQVQTSTDGNQVMPSWTVSSDPSIVLYPGTCESTNTCVRQLPEHTYPYRPSCLGKEQYKNGRPVQWDPNYLEYFEQLIANFAARYNDNPKVEAILMMSGGNYGEMAQTYGKYCHADCGTGLAPESPECPSPNDSCIAYVHDKKNIYIQEMLRAHPEETADNLVRPYSDGRYSYVSKFDYYYVENTKKLIDIYAKNFNKPVVLQLGSGPSCDGTVARAVADYAVETYGRKVWLKQNGWGNAVNGYDPYAYFFSDYRDKTRVIREVGHHEDWCQSSPVGSCNRTSSEETITHNNNAVKAAIESGISSVCFQGTQFLDARYFSNYPVNFSNLYQGLVSNYNQFYKSLPLPTGVIPGVSVSPAPTNTPRPGTTISPVPTNTLTPTPTATIAPNPTATATLAPGVTVSPTPTNTVTPTLTSTPVPGTTASPSPTATAMPTVTPTPTLGPDQERLAFEIKLYGIDDKVDDQDVEVRLKNGVMEKNYSTRVVFDSNGLAKGSITLSSGLKGKGFRVFVRARNHLWQEYCAFGQTWQCDKYDQGFTIPYSGVFDFSRWPVWPGDIADSSGGRDGVIDMADFSRLKSQIGKKGNHLTADLDFNGVVNGRDVALFLKSIEESN